MDSHTKNGKAPDQNLCCSILIIIIIIVIVETQPPPGESIDCECVRLTVFGAHRHDEPSAAYDLNVGPPVGHQLLSDLFFSHRPAALDEYWPAVALRRRGHEGGGSG